MIRTLKISDAINIAINSIKAELDAIYVMVNDPEPDIEPISWEHKPKEGVKDVNR